MEIYFIKGKKKIKIPTSKLPNVLTVDGPLAKQGRRFQLAGQILMLKCQTEGQNPWTYLKTLVD